MEFGAVLEEASWNHILLRSGHFFKASTDGRVRLHATLSDRET